MNRLLVPRTGRRRADRRALDAARDVFVRKSAVVFRRHQARIHDQAAGLDDEVVIAAAISGSADFLHQEPAPFRAVIGRDLVQRNDAVGQALDVRVARGVLVSSSSSVVQLRPAKNCLNARICRR